MDAAMLKVICDNYENRTRFLEAELLAARLMLHELDKSAICVAHGGHEFERETNMLSKCKFCGTTKPI